MIMYMIYKVLLQKIIQKYLHILKIKMIFGIKSTKTVYKKQKIKKQKKLFRNLKV